MKDDALHTIGNRDVLSQPLLGLLCSQKCPGDIILKTYDTMRALRDAETVVAGGFHSTMEKDCLDILLRGRQPIVVCVARSLDGMRIHGEWRTALDASRLVLVSDCGPTMRRVSRASAHQRNLLLLSLCDRLLVPHASQGGEVELVCRAGIAAGKTILTFPCPENAHMLRYGAVAYESR